jgi:hypothetical protein
LTQLSVSSPNANGYALYDGVIKYNNRIWLGNHKEAKDVIMLALHDSGIRGHSGFTTTYNKIRALFACNHMKHDIKTYVAHCTVCQQAKSEHVGSPGLLQPLPIPHKAWEIISLDFVEGFLKSSSSIRVRIIIPVFSEQSYSCYLLLLYTSTLFDDISFAAYIL